MFEQLFEEIVRHCVEVGLVQGQHLSVDGSFVEANAAKESRIPREPLAEAARVNQTVRQYLVELEQQNPTEEPVHQQDQISTTDPDATYAHALYAMARTRARIGGGRHHLRERGVPHATVIVHQVVVVVAQSRRGPTLGSACPARSPSPDPICGPVTVSTERTARSSVPSGSRINPKATAIAVRRGSH